MQPRVCWAPSQRLRPPVILFTDTSGIDTMKYTIYEDPVTHRFAHLPLAVRLLDSQRR